jgi:hypothetical protein
VSPNTTGRPVDRLMFSIHRTLKHLFDLFFGDTMVGTVLYIAIRIVVQVPEDSFEAHGASTLDAEL